MWMFSKREIHSASHLTNPPKSQRGGMVRPGRSGKILGSAARRSDLCVRLSRVEGAPASEELSGESNRRLPLFTSELRPINRVRSKLVKSAHFWYLKCLKTAIKLYRIKTSERHNQGIELKCDKWLRIFPVKPFCFSFIRIKELC